jgi:polygalacturonase
MKTLTIGMAAAATLAMIMTLPAMAAGKVCDVRTYGAKADGATKDTKAIQAAIDDCAGAGGGTVKLSGGVFLSAPIVLKSNITFDIAQGATLLGSPDHADYPAKTELRAPGTQSLVSATNAEKIAITGGGIIDGNGESWWVEARATHNAGVVGAVQFRPRLVVFDHCKHVPELAQLAGRAVLHGRHGHPQRSHPGSAALAEYRCY